MIELTTLQRIVAWVGLTVAVSSAIAFVLTILRSGPKQKIWSSSDIWVLLGVELIVFISVGGVIALNEELKVFSNYVAFAAPCVAGIVVGLGIVKRVANSGKMQGNQFLDYASYLVSIAILFGSLVAYIGANFSPRVIGWCLAVSSVTGFIAYLYAVSVRPIPSHSVSGKVPSVCIAGLLLFIILTIVSFLA